jgi:hypothetical protein
MKGKLLPRDKRPPTERKRTFCDAQKAGVVNRKWSREDSIALAYKKGDANDS